MRRSLLLAPMILAAAPADVLTIGGQPFPKADIVDARAIGDAAGPAILVTLGAAAAKRFAALTRARIGKPMSIRMGSRELSAPIIVEPVEGGSFQISGAFKSFPEAEALALKIAGKPPLPESLDE
jgi:preprotein translocase subunit SecD